MPEYPIFSRRAQRQHVPKYQVIKTANNDLVEKWFQERQHVRTTPSFPPGLNRVVHKATFCKICNKFPINSVTMACCKNVFCQACIQDKIDLYNRCSSCKTVVDKSNHHKYDGLDLDLDFDLKNYSNYTYNLKDNLHLLEPEYSTPLITEE
jgi:hypothetical protein